MKRVSFFFFSFFFFALPFLFLSDPTFHRGKTKKELEAFSFFFERDNGQNDLIYV